MDIRAALNAILADPQLHAVEHRLRDVSAFHILGVERWETAHSRFLAWLLDPQASHGAGAESLRHFMLLAAAAGTTQETLDVLDVDALDLDMVEVIAEYPIRVGDSARRADVVVLDSNERPLLVVEYKVDAEEGQQQTADYAAWARSQRFEIAEGRVVTPLLVFLCPDRDEATSPAPPFVHVRYEPYLRWLAAVRDRVPAQRARFLIEEFRSCLVQRQDVNDHEIEELVGALQRTHEEALDVIRCARREARAAFDPALLRHREVFEKLGVSIGRRASLGGSAFLEVVREELARALSPDLWTHGGGAGSIFTVFRPIAEAAQHLGQQVRLLVFADRPKDGRAYVRLNVADEARGVLSDKAARVRVADALRDALRATHADLLSRGQTVLSVKLPVPDINDLADDTPTRVAPLRGQIARAADRMREAEDPLRTWAESSLRDRLGASP